MQSPRGNASSTVPAVTRRDLLQTAGFTSLGLGLAHPGTALAATQSRSPQIKSCILIFYYGGPSHLDTFDMKPEAPAEVRGEFQPIATSMPGIPWS